jgi:hypothetical protein
MCKWTYETTHNSRERRSLWIATPKNGQRTLSCWLGIREWLFLHLWRLMFPFGGVHFLIVIVKGSDYSCYQMNRICLHFIGDDFWSVMKRAHPCPQPSSPIVSRLVAMCKNETSWYMCPTFFPNCNPLDLVTLIVSRLVVMGKHETSSLLSKCG